MTRSQCNCQGKKVPLCFETTQKYFNNKEMRMLLDSHFYSVLYYNANVWLTPSLASNLKQNLPSISACALRSCLMHEGFDISFENLHKIHKKCPPLRYSFINFHLPCSKGSALIAMNPVWKQ